MPSSPAASGRATLPQTLGIPSPSEPDSATAPRPAQELPDSARDASDRRTD